MIHVTVNVHNGRGEEAGLTSDGSGEEADHSLSVTHYANHSVEVHHYPDDEKSVGDYVGSVKTTTADWSGVPETTTTATTTTKTSAIKPEEYYMMPLAVTDNSGPSHSSYSDLNQYYSSVDTSDGWSQPPAQPHRELHITYNTNKDDHKGLQYMYKYHSVNHQSPKDSKSSDGESSRQLQHKTGHNTFGYSNGYLHGYHQGYGDGKNTSGLHRNQWGSDTGRRGSVSGGKGYSSNMRIPSNAGRGSSSGVRGSSSSGWGGGTNLRVQGSGGGGQVSGYGSQAGPPGCGVRCLWDDLMNILDHYSTSESSRVTGASATAGSLGLAVRQEVSGSVHQASSNTPHGNSFPPNNVHTRTPNSHPIPPVMNNFNNAFGRQPSQHVEPYFRPSDPRVRGRPRGDRRPPPPPWGQRGRPNLMSPSPHYSSFHARSLPDYDLVVDEGRVPSQATWEMPGTRGQTDLHNRGSRRRWDGVMFR